MWGIGAFLGSQMVTITLCVPKTYSCHIDGRVCRWKRGKKGKYQHILGLPFLKWAPILSLGILSLTSPTYLPDNMSPLNTMSLGMQICLMNNRRTHKVSHRERLESGRSIEVDDHKHVYSVS